MATRPEIVPFGKYKGQPLEALAQDRDYCDWLMAQDWFRTKFVGIHTLIVNHFGEAAETPEHNALQARFLDPDWCQRVCLSLGFGKEFTRYVEGYREGWAAFMAQPAESKTGARDRETLKDVDQRLAAVSWTFAIVDRRFEAEGIDVQFIASVAADQSLPTFWAEQLGRPFESKSWRWYCGHEAKKLRLERSCRIECKPRVADDYPAILRQMMASHATMLVAGDICSSAVSADQVRAIFAGSHIAVRTVGEIERQPPIW